MRKKLLKIASLLLVSVLCLNLLTGSGGNSEANMSGKISLAGSTSMEKVCEALMEGFMETYPDVTVTTEYTGSGAGLESLVAGSLDIGNASRHVKEEEASNGAVENVIALDGIAVIIDFCLFTNDKQSNKIELEYYDKI